MKQMTPSARPLAAGSVDPRTGTDNETNSKAVCHQALAAHSPYACPDRATAIFSSRSRAGGHVATCRTTRLGGASSRSGHSGMVIRRLYRHVRKKRIATSPRHTASRQGFGKPSRPPWNVSLSPPFRCSRATDNAVNGDLPVRVGSGQPNLGASRRALRAGLPRRSMSCRDPADRAEHVRPEWLRTDFDRRRFPSLSPHSVRYAKNAGTDCISRFPQIGTRGNRHDESSRCPNRPRVRFNSLG
jgi:hypothetical protein